MCISQFRLGSAAAAPGRKGPPLLLSRVSGQQRMLLLLSLGSAGRSNSWCRGGNEAAAAGAASPPPPSRQCVWHGKQQRSGCKQKTAAAQTPKQTRNPRENLGIFEIPLVGVVGVGYSGEGHTLWVN